MLSILFLVAFCFGLRMQITALKLIQEHGSIEGVIAKLDTKKYSLPEPFPFEEARALFKHPEVVDADAIEPKWTDVSSP